jgi:hypothetical protein
VAERTRSRRRAFPGARLYDGAGELTSDPKQAVRGELVESDAEGRPRRTWFLIEHVEIKWLPIGEGAFLLWVLTLFVTAWVAVALVLHFF